MRTSTKHLVFTLLVLLAINTMNFFDRQILPAVQEKIKEDWDLSDSQLGMLNTAFILLYAVIGLPLGRLADTWRRKWLLAIGVALWSLFTVASGLAWGFWSLFAFRLGVGVGEASCAPVASSLIGDLVPADKRARAMSFFMLGLPIGLALSLIVSGTIAQRYSWEAAFFVAGVPGFLLAVLALFIADPVRDATHKHGSDHPISEVVKRVLSLPTMWWIIASGALHNFNMYALGSFISSYFKRYHEISIERAGQISGLVYGFGAIGIFAAGWLGDLAHKRSVRGRLNVAWTGLLIAIPCLLMALAAPRGAEWQCAIWLLVGCMMFYAYYGTVYATIQDIVEPSLRGMAMAIYFFAMYFLGAVLGPVGMGWLSDTFARAAAQADGSDKVLPSHLAIGLHDAMYVIPILNAALVVVIFAASRTVKRDVQRLSDRATP